ncbi:lectin-like [Juglans microcarpa x Juglans regia]|uniref:lectin-like n=1 Tax=Juglans microcarpa x Juglans regia TaxID=2249226 RepID=UPI001B7E12B5|nr:lectin-like [Juglans microcarpa x Juglans regia]
MIKGHETVDQRKEERTLKITQQFLVNLARKRSKMTKKARADLNNSQLGFLEHKRKKKWVDQKTGSICFMLYARSLYVTWGAKSENWAWNCFKETSDENIEVAKLEAVCWLDVRGKVNMSELSPEVLYEVVYEVKLKRGASGWELPIILKLSLPDGRIQQRHVSLLEKPRGEWIELSVGCFKLKNGESGEVGFDIMEHGGHWKSGLIIRGAILRPSQRMSSTDL